LILQVTLDFRLVLFNDVVVITLLGASDLLTFHEVKSYR
jgi:hypothetical protein